MVLATVKGDVHDIGKNLVDIILSNNGYKVVDLGIKVAPAQLIEAIRKRKARFCWIIRFTCKICTTNGINSTRF